MQNQKEQNINKALQNLILKFYMNDDVNPLWVNRTDDTIPKKSFYPNFYIKSLATLS